MLAEVSTVFTESDNVALLVTPTEKEIKGVLSNSHLLASPGTDGIPSLLYYECWEIMKDSLMEMVISVFEESEPSRSQRESLMVFGSKPKKLQSCKPSDKRRISL